MHEPGKRVYPFECTSFQEQRFLLFVRTQTKRGKASHMRRQTCAKESCMLRGANSPGSESTLLDSATSCTSSRIVSGKPVQEQRERYAITSMANKGFVVAELRKTRCNDAVLRGGGGWFYFRSELPHQNDIIPWSFHGRKVVWQFSVWKTPKQESSLLCFNSLRNWPELWKGVWVRAGAAAAPNSGVFSLGEVLPSPPSSDSESRSESSGSPGITFRLQTGHVRLFLVSQGSMHFMWYAVIKGKFAVGKSHKAFFFLFSFCFFFSADRPLLKAHIQTLTYHVHRAALATSLPLRIRPGRLHTHRKGHPFWIS